MSCITLLIEKKMDDQLLKDLEKNNDKVYVSDSLKEKLNFDEYPSKNVFYVKINDYVYDLYKYKNTKYKTTFVFFLEMPLFKRIILSNFSEIDLYIDNIKARTFQFDKENINIKIKKIKNNYKIRISLKKNTNKKEIL